MVHLVLSIGLYLFFVPNNLFSPTLRPSDDDDPSLALTTPPDGDFILDPDATRVPCAFRFLYGSDAATFDNFASHVLHTMMRCAKGKNKKGSCNNEDNNNACRVLFLLLFFFSSIPVAHFQRRDYGKRREDERVDQTFWNSYNRET